MRTKIIAEIASGHSGDLELAKALIRSAAENGADIVKFQDWRAENVPDSDSDKARYEKYQFPDEWYPILVPYCTEHGAEFLTTVFNTDRAKHLADLGLKRIKLASISLTNDELLLECCKHFDEVILSTAMNTREEIEHAVGLLADHGTYFSILHCVANYPTKPEDANLLRVEGLQYLLTETVMEDWEYASVGYSDHSLDLDVAKAALCMDIKYLEKHFSLSRDLPQIPHQMYEGGPLVTTHQISIEPHELKELADWRDKVAVMKGDGQFTVNEVEQKIKSRYSKRYGV